MTTNKTGIICYGILFLAVLLFLAVSIFFGIRKHQEEIHAEEQEQVMIEEPVTVQIVHLQSKYEIGEKVISSDEGV